MRIDGIAAYLHSAGRMSREWRTVVVHATSCARTSLSPVCTHSNTVYSSSSLCCTSAPSVCASGLLSAATHTISANDLRSADAAKVVAELAIDNWISGQITRLGGVLIAGIC